MCFDTHSSAAAPMTEQTSGEPSQMPTRDASSRGRSIRPSTPEDGPAIVALMRAAGLEPTVDPAHLHWKYWQSRADWSGPRSFVVADGAEVLAHGALVPGTLRSPGAEARVIHMIDWAARREAIGAGVQLMKHVGNQADFLLGIGGSEHTRKIMPLIGYRLCGKVTGFVRPLAPLRLLKEVGGPPWKRIARSARSALWSVSAPRVRSSAWSSRPVTASEVAQMASVLPAPRAGLAVLGRTPAFFKYALTCPIVSLELHALHRAGHLKGYFALSYASSQIRLADLWVDSADPEDWRGLVLSAVRAARRKQEAVEIAAWSSDPALSLVLHECGFHARFTLPIYLRGSHGARDPEKSLRVQMLDNDAFYLHSDHNELWA